MPLIPWQPRHRKEVIRLIHDTFAEYGEGVWLDDCDEDLENPQAWYESRGGAFIVLEIDGKVAGCHALQPVQGMPGVVTFRRLYVARTFRGQGHGATLMTWALGWARENGFQRVEFLSDIRFGAAHQFFRRFGFERTGKIRWEADDSLVPYSEYQFALDLTQPPVTPKPIQRPTLTTPRLILRPMLLEDAEVVEAHAGQREVARTTATIPHPYPEGSARPWIESHGRDFAQARGLVLAITLRETQGVLRQAKEESQECMEASPAGPLIGCVGLANNLLHKRADLGYWMGLPWWGQGYVTEAALALIDFGFQKWDLERIQSHHLGNNPASGRVMEKIGMTREGILRRSFLKWGRFQDTIHYAILREDWQARAGTIST